MYKVDEVVASNREDTKDFVDTRNAHVEDVLKQLMSSLKRHKRFCRYKKCISPECVPNSKCLWKDTKGFVDTRNPYVQNVNQKENALFEKTQKVL